MIDFPAIVNGQQIHVRFGCEGQIWTWDNGQVLLARSDQSEAWVRKHVSTGGGARWLALRTCKDVPARPVSNLGNPRRNAPRRV